MNVSSLTSPVLPNACVPAALPYIPILDTSLAVASCWKEVGKAIQMISACPFSKSFWERVHGEAKFSIECLPAEVLNHPAMVRTNKRSIQVSTFQYPSSTGIMPTSMLRSILFELNNLNQARALLDVHHNKCSMHAVNYSKSVEAIEYITNKNTIDLFRECVSQSFWTPDELEMFGHTGELSLEQNLEMQMRLGHTSAYQLGWHRACDPEGVHGFKLILAQLEQVGVPLPYNFYSDSEPNTPEELDPFGFLLPRSTNQRGQKERQEASSADEWPPARALEDESRPDIDVKEDQSREETSQDWWSQAKDAITRFFRF